MPLIVLRNSPGTDKSLCVLILEKEKKNIQQILRFFTALTLCIYKENFIPALLMCRRKCLHSKLQFPSSCFGKYHYHMIEASHHIPRMLSNWKHVKPNIWSSTLNWNGFSGNTSTISNKQSVLIDKFWAGGEKSKFIHFKLWINHSFRNSFCHATGLMSPSPDLTHTFPSFHPAD